MLFLTIIITVLKGVILFALSVSEHIAGAQYYEIEVGYLHESGKVDRDLTAVTC